MESTKTVAGVLIGIGVGTLIGLLFAPDKGSNIRKKIVDKGHGLADDLKSKYEGLRKDATEKYDTLLDEINPELTRK